MIRLIRSLDIDRQLMLSYVRISTVSKRKLLVTSALPYANGPLHLGHMVEYIQTDIFVRYHRLIGNTCHYFCADDTHGTPITLNAKKKGMTPEAFVAAMYDQHVADFHGFGIEFDYYGSTNSEHNRTLIHWFYEQACQQGVITDRVIQQFFCSACDIFLPDRLIKGTCPNCQALDQYGDVCEVCATTYNPTDLVSPTCATCRHVPDLRDSLHYFFKLDAFQSFLHDWLAQAGLPDDVKNKLKEWFKAGLKDWDISRDAPYFGFQIPGSDNKYFYVWVDAPIGYIATSEAYAAQNGGSFRDFWMNTDVEIHHFIGKDILYFHGLFWPAMLNVMGLNYPDRINVHGFLTVNGEKMSKSRGTFILASDFLAECEPDFLRYYFAAKLTAKPDDIDFNETDFINRVNSDVLGKLINIGSRVGSILKKQLQNQLSEPDQDGQQLLATIRSKAVDIRSDYDALAYSKLVRDTMALADLVNTYIQDKAPWAVVKDDPIAAQAVCTTALNSLRYLSIYLKPIIPTLVSRLEQFLQVAPLQWSDLDQLLCHHQVNDYAHVAKRLDSISFGVSSSVSA